MRFLYTSDLHGHDPFYRELLALAGSQNVQAIILGGDLFPRKGHSDQSLENQKQYVRTSFRSFLQEIRNTPEISLYCILGNDDFAGVIPLMEKLEKEKFLTFMHNRTVPLTEGIAIAGYPFIPPTPFPVKDFEKRDRTDDNNIGSNPHAFISMNGKIVHMEVAEWFSRRNTIEEDLKQFVETSGSNDKLIHVIHAPPYDTALDCLHDGQAIGSRAVREYIEKRQPLMTLHGHIHESPKISGKYWQKLGQTLSINPGQNTDRFSAVTGNLSSSGLSVTHTILGKAEFKS
jgi:Icc-related predicted phosphoesterase